MAILLVSIHLLHVGMREKIRRDPNGKRIVHSFGYSECEYLSVFGWAYDVWLFHTISPNPIYEIFVDAALFGWFSVWFWYLTKEPKEQQCYLHLHLFVNLFPVFVWSFVQCELCSVLYKHYNALGMRQAEARTLMNRLFQGLEKTLAYSQICVHSSLDGIV